MLAELATIVAPTMLCAQLGYVWRRSGQPFDPVFVAKLVSAVGAPFLVFSALTRLPTSLDALGQMALAAVLSMAGFALLGGLALWAARLPLRDYLPVILFPNAGNMGLPVCLFAFGEAGLALAIVYSTLTSVAQLTVGLSISVGTLSLRRLARLPVLYGLGAALAFRFLDTPPPDWLAATARLLGDLTIPLMLLALGAALAELKPVKLPRTLALSLLRLIGGAAIGLAVARLMNLDALATAVVMTQSAMPVAVFTYLFAQQYDRSPREVASSVLVSTALSILLLPALLGALLPL